MQSLIPVLLLALSCRCFEFTPLQVQADSPIINTLTRYQFLLNRARFENDTATPYLSSPIAPTDTFTVLFPPIYTLSSVWCEVQVDGGLRFASNCTAVGQVVTISNILNFSYPIANVSVWIFNIRNPAPASITPPFGGSIGSDTASLTTLSNYVQLQPDSFANCYATFSPRTVNSTGNMIVTLTPKTPIQAGGRVTVGFPVDLRWARDLSPTNRYFQAGVATCSSLSNNLAGTITCGLDIFTSTVTASDLFNSTVSSAFTFSIDNIYSPPSNQQVDRLRATSFSASGDAIDQCDLYISDLVPRTARSLTIRPNSNTSTMVVNSFNTLRFELNISDTVSRADTYTLVFPPATVLNQPSARISFGSGSEILQYQLTTGTLSLNPNTTGSNIAVNQLITIILAEYQAPPSIEPTSEFTLTVLSNGFPKMVATATLAAVAGTCAGTVTVVNSTIFVNTSYVFSVGIGQPLSSSGRIRIVLPVGVGITSNASTCARVVGNRTALQPICTYNLGENSITLSSLNSSLELIPTQTLQITLLGLTNPSSTAPTGSFLVRTFHHSTETSLATTCTLAPITPTPAAIPSPSVTVAPSSDIVNQASVTYQIVYNVSHAIPAGGRVLLVVPGEIGVLAVGTGCSVNVNSTSYMVTQCVGANATGGVGINFTSPFLSDVQVGSVVAFRIASVFRNPVSTRPTSSFRLYTYHANGFNIGSVETGITVQMHTFASFTSIDVTRDGNRNSELTSYQFRVVQGSPYEPASVLLITLPGNIRVSTNSACAMSLPAVTSLSCQISANTIAITLPNAPISAGAPVMVSISSIRNPDSFQPVGTFTFQSKTPQQLFDYSLQSYLPTLTNNVASLFGAVAYEFVPAVLGEPVTLRITFDPSDSSKVPTRLRVSLAQSFALGTVACSAFVDFSGMCTVLTPYLLQVTGTFTRSPMSFTIAGLIAPIAGPADFTQLTTYDNSYKIDESLTDVKFVAGCLMPCRTCRPSQPSSCTSCYNNTLITSLIYFDAGLGVCSDSCSDGRIVNITTFLCDLCDSRCRLCTNVGTNCTGCFETSVFKFLYVNTSVLPYVQSCMSSCLPTFYPNPTNLCVTCLPSCLTCTALNVCSSCPSGRFLLGTSCQSSCPAGLAIENPITNQCDLCDLNCATCSLSTINCLTCSPLLVLHLNRCRSACPPPLVPFNSVCVTCHPSCRTCAGDPLTCTSCNTNSSLAYLFNNRCQSACPQTYYRDTVAGACSPCSNVTGLNCNNCSSVSTCLSCDPGYALFNSACIDFIPFGHVIVLGAAVPCTGDCATCSLTTDNCTSCITNNLFNNQCRPTCPPGWVPVSRVCQPCRSPCATCTVSPTSCTSCMASLSPSVFLTAGRCVQACPDGTYAEISNSTCAGCVSPCEYCTSRLDCRSCLNGYFLTGQRCEASCPPGTAGVNRRCLPCEGNCATCRDETTICVTCVNNTYLFELNSTCLVSCGAGLYQDTTSQKCIYCLDPCRTCRHTATTCLSCVSGSLFNSTCLPECPEGFFSQVGTCSPCLSICATCSSLSVCSSCQDPYLLYNGFCVNSCPATHAIVIERMCTLCVALNCHECKSIEQCTMCDRGYLLLNGSCLGACPVLYTSNGTHCLEINEQVLTSTTAFPVPFSIGAAVVVIACLMSKLQYSNTYLAGAIFGMVGLVEVGSLGYFVYLYFGKVFINQPLPFFVAIAALGYLCLLNISSLIFQNVIICADRQFKAWNKHYPNCVSAVVVNLFGVIVSHKFRNVLFCKLFTFSIFTAQLENVTKFKILNIFSFLSLVYSAAAVFSAAVTIGAEEKNSQLFYACIDVIVVHAFNAVMAFFNTWKSKDFFVERAPEGFDLKRKINIGEQLYKNELDSGGAENQDQQGYYSNIYHVQGSGQNQQPVGMSSNKPLRKTQHKTTRIGGMKDESLGSLAEEGDEQLEENRKYQEASIQAVEMIDDTSFGEQQAKLDITAVPHINELNIKQRSAQPLFKTDKPQVDNKSTQQYVPRLIEKSMREQDQAEPMDKPAQRTVFFKHDQSMQQASAMMVPSMVAQKFTMERKNSEAGNSRSLRQQANQASFGSSSKVNHTQSARMTQQTGRSKKLKFDQLSQQIGDLAEDNQISEEVGVDAQPVVKELKEQQKDELLLPREQIKSYQEELEDRIRNKERELERIRWEIEMQERVNQDKSVKLANKPKFEDQSNKTLDKKYIGSDDNEIKELPEEESLQASQQRHALRTEHRQVEQQSRPRHDVTLEEVEVQDEEGQAKKIKVEINDAADSRISEQEIGSPLNPARVVFQELQENIKDSSSEHEQQLILVEGRDPENAFQKKKYQFQSLEAEISSGKGNNSTKFDQSNLLKNSLRLNPPIEDRLDSLVDSSSSIDPINENPFVSFKPRLQNDSIKTIKQVETDGHNNEQFVKKFNMKSPTARSKKKIPKDEPDNHKTTSMSANNLKIKDQSDFSSNNNNRTSLLIAGKNHLRDEVLIKKEAVKGSPLKAAKKWQEQNTSREITESQKQQASIKNSRMPYAHFVSPLQTDLEAMQFRDSKFRGSHTISRSKADKITRKSSDREVIEQASPFDKSQQPKPRVDVGELIDNFPTQQFDKEENQELGPKFHQQSQEVQRIRNNLIIGQMLSRPSNGELERFYSKKLKHKKSNTRQQDKADGLYVSKFDLTKDK